jgi:putative membrane protein
MALFFVLVYKKILTMKTIKLMSLLLAASFFVLVSCDTKSTRDDSKEIAEEQNDEKFEDTDLKNDTEFAVEAADGGMLEVQLAQLALTKATSPRVKEYAQAIIDDHSKSNEELKSLAQSKNISLPTTLSEKNQKKYNDLAEKSGTDFDEAYSEFMVKDHKDDVNKFKKAARNAEDGDIKSWAAGKVPILEQHLSMAESLEEDVDDIEDNK